MEGMERLEIEGVQLVEISIFQMQYCKDHALLKDGGITKW